MAAVGMNTLHEGEARSRALQRAFATLSVLEVSATDVHSEQAAVGVG